MLDFAPLSDATLSAIAFLKAGGPSIWAIAALSVITVALIFWKIWDLIWLGAWTGGRRVEGAITTWQDGNSDIVLADLRNRRTIRARFARTAFQASSNPEFDRETAQDETLRVAKLCLARARAGLRPLELIANIAPLLGLLGTVLGMISAFQALQEAGARADPSMLAGGIWEALLTTAAGMAVAIPASVALTWFESITDRLRLEMEDIGTRIFQTTRAQEISQASTGLAAE
ncbi:MotA/TolQ/ExbB proton channel family protein [Sulfitobacter sp. AS59]|uniref:MotA/TolQ/ExbB proton channel family protein n=1 Tax=Sulfitobacter sp. AS59 TaxID=3135784 RepID=UPI00319DD7D2